MYVEIAGGDNIDNERCTILMKQINDVLQTEHFTSLS